MLNGEILWQTFMNQTGIAFFDAAFPSGSISISSPLGRLLHMKYALPVTFDQWCELCHPDDHFQILALRSFIFKSLEPAFSAQRRLYCGDGLYRTFLLRAFCSRDERGSPLRLLGYETEVYLPSGITQPLYNEVQKLLSPIPGAICFRRAGEIAFSSGYFNELAESNPSLTAWVLKAGDGDEIHCYDSFSRVCTFRAAVPSSAADFEPVALHDITEQLELKREALNVRQLFQLSRLRHGFFCDDVEQPAPAGHDETLSTIIGGISDILKGLGADAGFSGNLSELHRISEGLKRTSLNIGVIGIADSGKSSLINTLMGEKLLPEGMSFAASPPVQCRKGRIRKLEIFSGGVSEVIKGSALNPRRMAGLLTGRGFAESMIWTSPGAAFSEGITFIENPELMPFADMIIYALPVRCSLKATELEFIRAALEGEDGKKMIFLITKTDLEQDDTEGGRVIRSKAQKLSEQAQELKHISRASLTDSVIIPVSAKLGSEYFYDRSSGGWRESNLEALLNHIELSYSRTRFLRSESGGRQAIAVIEFIISELEAGTGVISTDTHDRQKAIDALKGKVSELQACLDSIAARAVDSSSEQILSHVQVSGDYAGKPDDSPFLPLIEAIHELRIQARFLSLPALTARRKLIFTGLRRRDSLALLSRLAHDISWTQTPTDREGRVIGDGDWIFCGRTPPALPHVRITPPDSILRELDIIITPDVQYCSQLSSHDWEGLFSEWLPVVHLDIARPDLGLPELERAPYSHALAGVSRWVAASGQGAMFNARLSDLASAVPEGLDKFISLRRWRGVADWFIYENYDSRYTDFLLLGQQIDENSGMDDIAALISLWTESGLDFRPPFTERVLKMWLMKSVNGEVLY